MNTDAKTDREGTAARLLDTIPIAYRYQPQVLTNIFRPSAIKDLLEENSCTLSLVLLWIEKWEKCCMVPLGGAVKYDRIDFIFAARAAVQTDTRAVVSVVTVVITNVKPSIGLISAARGEHEWLRRLTLPTDAWIYI